ncbi:MAG TPA: GntR family transcriptional regulator [Solirubrobacteraceae bacterium]|nr:GntR family transcriptional regulator [Solirubrobacteraceae bacterium]
MARELGVNMHTVLRAYAELREDGLVDVRRGRGTVVRGDGSAGRAAIRALVQALTVEARRQGLSRQELHGMIEEFS